MSDLSQDKAVSFLRNLVHLIAVKFAENPIKIYATIYFFGDLILGANPTGGFLWRLGAAIGATANFNKMIFGRGGERIDPSLYKLTWRDVGRTMAETASLPLALLTRAHWVETRELLQALDRRDVVSKILRSLCFWRYPLDAGWMLYFMTGSCYFLDVLLRGEPSRFFQAIVGLSIVCGSAIGFLTENNKLTGRIFSFVTCISMGIAIFSLNWAFFFSALAYQYGNYLISRVLSSHQSDFTREAFDLAALQPDRDP